MPVVKQARVYWVMAVTALLALAVVVSGVWFTVVATQSGLRDAILGRRFPAAPLGLFVTVWGLMYLFRIVRLVSRKRATAE